MPRSVIAGKCAGGFNSQGDLRYAGKRCWFWVFITSEQRRRRFEPLRPDLPEPAYCPYHLTPPMQGWARCLGVELEAEGAGADQHC
jgi:hypothetical protein